MHDNRIELVTLDHTDIKETSVFSVHGIVHNAALGIAMVLRGLHEADCRIAEQRREVLKPVGAHHVVRVDHTDYFGVRRRMRESQT